jgi:uncharacterized membrane protein YkgB
MNHLDTTADRLSARLAPWLERVSVDLLRLSLGLIFLIFGLLKFVPGLSPAEDLVMSTVSELSFGMMPERLGLILVAALESTIGLCLLTGWRLRLGLTLLGVAMIGILSPLVLVPEQLFRLPLLIPTLAGQYVLKDIVLLAAALVVTASALSRPVKTEHEDRSARDHGDIWQPRREDVAA